MDLVLASDQSAEYYCIITDACEQAVSEFAAIVLVHTPGDVDLDGNVALSDLSTLLENFGTPFGALWEKGDIDGDVDIADLSALLANFGLECAVP